jgi:hypothetical protein
MDDGSNIDLKIRIDKQTVFFIVIWNETFN